MTNKENKWQILCFRFIGRNRRMARWEKMIQDGVSIPNAIVEHEKNLIQKAYDEMRDACMNDEWYQAFWEENEGKLKTQTNKENYEKK
jgi:hypothetical protein